MINRTPLFTPQCPQISLTKPHNTITTLRLSYLPLFPKGSFIKASMADLQSHVNNVFNSEEELAASLANYTAHLSNKVVNERGAFTVVLSGGSPIKSLRYLSLLVMFMPPTLPAEGAAEDYETCLKQLVKSNVIATSPSTGFPKFDLQLLGMGPDVHVASLFPAHLLVKEDKKWVTFIKDSPKPPPERITFTFPVINSSAYVALVICGGDKTGAVKTVLGGNQTSTCYLLKWFTPEVVSRQGSGIHVVNVSMSVDVNHK